MTDAPRIAGCNKIGHPTLAQARKAARAMSGRGHRHGRLTAFYCTRCLRYHTGHGQPGYRAHLEHAKGDA